MGNGDDDDVDGNDSSHNDDDGFSGVKLRAMYCSPSHTDGELNEDLFAEKAVLEVTFVLSDIEDDDDDTFGADLLFSAFLDSSLFVCFVLDDGGGNDNNERSLWLACVDDDKREK